MTGLTARQARRFLLLHHGLLGAHRFTGKAGALAFVRQAGCIQFDPVNVCGRNAELTLQSRVKGFAKDTLDALLYEDRALIDYPDKNLSILPVEDWPYMERYRARARRGGREFPGLEALEAQALAYIGAHGPVASDELPIEGSIAWHSSIHWSGNWHGESNAARSVLEQLYSTGALVIHHKRGTRKVYDLASRHIAPELLAAPDPLPEEPEHIAWRVKRRIGAVGMLWNRASDAWLGILGLRAPERNAAFETLLARGEILTVRVEGVPDALYLRACDEPALRLAMSGDRFSPRCEVIAPLDPLMWDRKLIRALFGFDYRWEIYTPAEKRRFGYYVLPLLYGEGFAGRVEAVAQNGTLCVRHVWLEDGVRQTKAMDTALAGCMRRLARMNGCGEIAWEENQLQSNEP